MFSSVSVTMRTVNMAVPEANPKFLVCGLEREQVDGRTDEQLQFERFWVHLATFSAQEGRGLTWWPVPPATVRGDLFVVALAGFKIPDVAKKALDSRRKEPLEDLNGDHRTKRTKAFPGAKGDCAVELYGLDAAVNKARSVTRLGLFDSEPGSPTVSIPLHPEFKGDNKNLGGGIVGIGVALTDARKRGSSYYFQSELTMVILPDILKAEHFRRAEVWDRLRALEHELKDDENSMKDRWEAGRSICVDGLAAEDWILLKEFMYDFFNDDQFRDDLKQLEIRAGEIASGNRVDFELQGPPARWEWEIT